MTGPLEKPQAARTQPNRIRILLAHFCMSRFDRHAPKGNYTAALRWVDRAASATPRDVMPVEARAYLQLRMGYTVMAIEDLKIVAAQKWYEGSTRAVHQLATLLRDADHHDEADRYLRMHGESVRDLADPAFT